jgi:hypothetical protein
MNATTQSAYLAQIVDTMARFSAWLYDILIGFVRSLTNGQRALLIAEIGFASVSAPLQRRQPATVDYATLQDDPTPIMADAAQFVRL